jgi:hypothetical protein
VSDREAKKLENISGTSLQSAPQKDRIGGFSVKGPVLQPCLDVVAEPL